MRALYSPAQTSQVSNYPSPPPLPSPLLSAPLLPSPPHITTHHLQCSFYILTVPLSSPFALSPSPGHLFSASPLRVSPFLAVLMEHAAQDPATEMLSSLAGGDAMERNEKLRKDQTLLCCQGSALRIMSACVSERDFCVCAPTKTISVCVCVCVCL